MFSFSLLHYIIVVEGSLHELLLHALKLLIIEDEEAQRGNHPHIHAQAIVAVAFFKSHTRWVLTPHRAVNRRVLMPCSTKTLDSTTPKRLLSATK